MSGLIKVRLDGNLLYSETRKIGDFYTMLSNSSLFQYRLHLRFKPNHRSFKSIENLKKLVLKVLSSFFAISLDFCNLPTHRLTFYTVFLRYHAI